jgi:FMN-dependent NADH-azoreductase
MAIPHFNLYLHSNGIDMRLLQVDASPKTTGSSSKKLSHFFVKTLQKGLPSLDTDYLDVSLDTPPHISEEFINAIYTPASKRDAEKKRVLSYSDKLCARVMMSDILVFSMPMYNFSMPSSFKAFIDNLVRSDLTFTINRDGTTTGRLSQQKVLFITTRAADLRVGISPWSYMDALTPSLKAAFSFIGVDHPYFVDAQPLVAENSTGMNEALRRAYLDLESIAQKWIEVFK